jgi:HK97 family phage major capsid protein
MDTLEQKLTELIAEQKSFRAKAEAEQKEHGTILEQTKTALEAVQKQVDAIDKQLAERHSSGQADEPLEESLAKDDSLQRLMRDKKGTCVLHLDAKQHRQLMERKTTITSAAVGASATGVLPIERTPGIVTEARQRLMIADLLTRRPTTFQLIDFVKVNAAPKIASPQTEGSDKGENAVTFTSSSEKVQTIATWIPATRQVLDDMAELMGFLRNMLPYLVDQEEERELLSGAGVTDLHGLITQATAYDTSLTPAAAGWNKIDIIGRAIQQVVVAKETEPTFVVMHPTDWFGIRLTKDTYGRYILGDPMGALNQENLFGLRPVVTTAIASGKFLVGSGSPVACEIRDRMGMEIEIATQHASYFTANLIAIRCEKRCALIVYRPASYIYGTFTTSP